MYVWTRMPIVVRYACREVAPRTNQRRTAAGEQDRQRAAQQNPNEDDEDSL